MSWIDIILIITLGLSIFIGYKKGFILTLFSLGSYVVAYIFSKAYYENFANWMKENLPFTDTLNQLVTQKVDIGMPELGNVSSEVLAQNEGLMVNSINNELSGSIPTFFQSYLVDNLDITTYANQTFESVKGQIVEGITTIFFNIISMIILFMVIRLVVMIVGIIINKVFDLPILGAFNNLGGAILGSVRGLILILLIIVITLPISMGAPEGAVAIATRESFLIQVVFNNMVGFILSGIGTIGV
ncbi:CvpA family protein [Serpentinicella sp. ANB-PHB4]|uniref:CvpA family protein n=1 Tax=Serpentinicella sp. ANB-PHB4 TaxID=3074076 RepID=UPI00285EAD25|nr:CvpA family protein [Serpentinicella sp. ANB-PHB4]MDR5658891.1 CvpA family protein [Serpentinicella sp. ANB-PHB4]